MGKKKPPVTSTFDDTQSIEASAALPDEVTTSGSFDVRQFRTSTFGKLLQALPLPALLIDQSFRITFANQATDKIGPECGRLLGEPLAALCSDVETGKTVESLADEVFSTRTSKSCEAVLCSGDTKVWGRLFFRSLRVEEQRLILLIVEDLTLEKRQLIISQGYQAELQKEIGERKKAEVALEVANRELEDRIRQRTDELVKLNAQLEQEIRDRERTERLLYDSQQRLELALKGADLGLWDYDVQREEVFVDRTWAALLGYSPDETEPRVDFWRSLMHPDDRHEVIEEWNRQLEGLSGFFEAEHRVKAKSGEWRWILARGKVVERDRDGRPLRFSGTSFDVTARKHVEEKLLQMSKVFRESIDPIFIRDLEGNIADLNEAAVATYGWSREELIGRSIKTIVAPDRHEKADELQERCRSGEEVGNVEALHCTKSGKTIPVLLSLSLLTNDKGEPVGIATITKNLSDLKKTEEMLRARTRELERSNEELQEFAYVAAHDLREPLIGVAAYVKLLSRHLKDRLDKESHEFISRCLSTIDRMDTLIQNLLSYSRLGSAPLVLEPSDLNTVLESALSNLKPRIDESGATVTRDALPTVIADPAQMVLLFQNLLSNAMKFRSSKPLKIHVGFLKNFGKWGFFVSDNGIGVDPAHAEKIFRLFQRIEGSSDRPGTGIGLAHCKKIVENHGGRIWVESKLGEGSTFYFTISRTVVV
ncbi:MAG: PAS domain S-box protein [Desulfomonile tiedjei]|nr:PAS domain S-box protein [Desulfomonile tiedjei]